MQGEHSKTPLPAMTTHGYGLWLQCSRSCGMPDYRLSKRAPDRYSHKLAGSLQRKISHADHADLSVFYGRLRTVSGSRKRLSLPVLSHHGCLPDQPDSAGNCRNPAVFLPSVQNAASGNSICFHAGTSSLQKAADRESTDPLCL